MLQKVGKLLLNLNYETYESSKIMMIENYTKLPFRKRKYYINKNNYRYPQPKKDHFQKV